MGRAQRGCLSSVVDAPEQPDLKEQQERTVYAAATQQICVKTARGLLLQLASTGAQTTTAGKRQRQLYAHLRAQHAHIPNLGHSLLCTFEGRSAWKRMASLV